MSNENLDRVDADLAMMKQMCVEPAIPSEDIGLGLVLAGLFTVLVIAAWFLPVLWVKLALTMSLALVAAVYIPRKWRTLESDAPRRRLEIKELIIWGVAAIGLAGYFLFRRFAFPANANHAEEIWRQDAGTVLFFVGLAVVANGLVHPTRRSAIVPGVIAMIGGLLCQLTTSTAAAHSVAFGAAAVYCLANSAGLAWLTRSKERSEHGSH
jgi:hypothetical protein